MGSSNYTYIGVYALVKNKVKTVERKRTVYKNEKTGQVFKNPVKFDPNTGDPVSKLKEKYNENVAFSGWYDLLNELDLHDSLDEDAFFEPAYSPCPKGYSLLLSNYSNRGQVGDKDEEGCIVDIEPDIIEKTMKSFLEGYSEEIRYLKEFYGEENIDIKFGVVNYAH